MRSTVYCVVFLIGLASALRAQQSHLAFPTPSAAVTVRPDVQFGMSGSVALAMDLYQLPGIAGTVNFDHIKRHYYVTHEEINPTRIVPIGPALDLMQPHGREKRLS